MNLRRPKHILRHMARTQIPVNTSLDIIHELRRELLTRLHQQEQQDRLVTIVRSPLANANRMAGKAPFSSTPDWLSMPSARPRNIRFLVEGCSITKSPCVHTLSYFEKYLDWGDIRLEEEDMVVVEEDVSFQKNTGMLRNAVVC